jgi:hypothetical protein
MLNNLKTLHIRQLVETTGGKTWQKRDKYEPIKEE